MTSPTPFRIAVLLCDTPVPKVVAAQGDYEVIFRTLFQKSLKSLEASTLDSDLDFVVDAYDIRNKMLYPENVDQYDGILLTGSGMSSPMSEVGKASYSPLCSCLCI